MAIVLALIGPGVPLPSHAADAKAQSPADAMSNLLSGGKTDMASAVVSAQTTFTVTFGTDQPAKPNAPPPSPRMEAARLQIEAAQAYSREAERLRGEAAAVATSNPVYAEHLQHLALEKYQDGQRWLAKANANMVAPPAPLDQVGLSRPAGQADGCGKAPGAALCQLIAISSLNDQGGRGFEGATTVPGAALAGDTTVAPTDKLFRGRAEALPTLVENGGQQALKLAQGPTMDLAPLTAAIAQVDPKLAGQQLLTPCASEGGVCPTSAFLGFLADPAKREALFKIGGVELDATLDVLAVSGLSELRGGANISLVDHPTVLSLRTLLDAASPYATPEAWAHAPDSVRFPGNLARIKGYVLDPAHGDILLIGTTAPDAGSRIDVDELILAIRQVWRDGKTMAVSLDPRPDDIGGLQYARVIEMPPDSIVARIMLDADYAMKAVTMAAGWAAPLDLIGLKAMLASHGQEMIPPSMSRFWLSPRYLGSGSVVASTTGRTLLLETGVDARTEEMVIHDGVFEGKGVGNSFDGQIAGRFTEGYPKFEADARITPPHVFLRLHGLIDLTTIAEIWHVKQLKSPLLSHIADLPIRRLTGGEAVPSAYPGVTSVLPYGNGKIFATQGGVQLELHAAGTAERAYRDHVVKALEGAVDGRRQGVLAQSVDFVFAMPAGGAADQDRKVDDDLLAAQRALERGDYVGAAAGFDALIERMPGEPMAYAGRALVELQRGQPRSAAPYVLNAMHLAPADAATRLLALDTSWRIDPRAAYGGFSDGQRRDLSRHYLRGAAIAQAHGRGDEAELLSGWSADLWEDNGDAHMFRAFSKPEGSEQREQLLARAVRAYRHQLTGGAAEARQQLALALTISASQHIARASYHLNRFVAPKTPDETEAGLALALLGRAREEARDATEVDGELPAAASTRLLIDAAAVMTMESGRESALATLHSRASDLVGRFPQDPGTFMAQAEVLQLEGDAAGARAAMDTAVSIAPHSSATRIMRAELRAAQGDCAGAASDIAIARQLAAGEPDTGDIALSETALCR